jgi:transposase-like protein
MEPKEEGRRNDDAGMYYTDTIKARMLRRMLGPKAVSANALAQETGISQSTLSKWLRETGSFRAMAGRNEKKEADVDTPARRPQNWAPKEKLRAVVDTSELDGEALGEYLREHGIHREQLDQWRADAESALEKPRARRSSADTKRIKELERELRHKEKALAETAALLVLRKKLNALWGDADDDTDGKNEP